MNYLEEKIEETRQKMYDCYSKGQDYHQVLKFSQELDHLLNELTETKTPQINR
ncbi:aspartyl-phosphate phosphatase Spo0E family protein [Halobacillus salinus]|uniref:Aspartyl-phosphate phosphatase Spo0E family protein n=1 Tax=Halobacillus salinus TaxID=192814 RepID=A0A4Z0GTW6_9BACI|nr:aspartyl-phosphate phosphatase Spo0E family protein [Halobacillus salinus]TGB01030.1 aspartyl-phosphate phosphatase Spo0E family protein [Halobacillus salinus]